MGDAGKRNYLPAFICFPLHSQFRQICISICFTGIQDISKRSDLPKVLMKVEEKFRLDLTDEQAEQYFLGLINEALYSLAPRLMEVAHKFAVAMR